jgi:hypothetical protein
MAAVIVLLIVPCWQVLANARPTWPHAPFAHSLVALAAPLGMPPTPMMFMPTALSIMVTALAMAVMANSFSHHLRFPPHLANHHNCRQLIYWALPVQILVSKMAIILPVDPLASTRAAPPHQHPSFAVIHIFLAVQIGHNRAFAKPFPNLC